MKKYKVQLSIIVALTGVLVLLICATVVQARTVISAVPVPVTSGEDKPAEESPDPTANYSIERSSRLSLGDAEIENNFGGTGEETLVAAIPIEDKLYVFFNTASADCDLADGEGAAVIILDRDLYIKKVSRLPGEIMAAIPGEGGFAVATNVGGTVSVGIVGLDGTLAAGTAVPRAGEVKSLYLTDGGYMLVSKIKTGSLEKSAIHVCALSFDLSLRYERTITAGYSLDPIAAYTRGEETFVFFNASSDLGNHIGVAKCTSANETVVSYLSRFENHSASAVVPFSGGFAIGSENGVIVTDGETVLRTLDSSALPRLYYADGLYYAFSGTATAFDESFTKRFDLDYFADKGEIVDCVAGKGYGVFLGETADALTVTANENRLGLKLNGNFGACLLVRSDNDWFVIAEACAKSADVGSVFGETDIWVARLRI